ncbi:MAG: YbaY family lipoprotein [Halioglobus sp.]
MRITEFKFMQGFVRAVGLIVLAGLLIACSEGAGTFDTDGRQDAVVGKVEGAVVYRERMALPPGAIVEVELQDISRADAPASVMATLALTPEGGPPYNFSIEYDPAQIDEQMRYALHATIRLDDRLLFTNMDYIDAFSGNPVEVLVQRVPERITPPGPTFENTVWVLQALNGEPATPGAQGKPIDLQFQPGEMRVAGFSGCNQYMGGYTREGSNPEGSPLGFGLMAGTLMACPEGGDLERTYMQMLGLVSSFRLQGETLSLLAGGDVVASYKPR